MKIAKISITKVFTFDCAHHLNDYPGKCKNIHGHTYKLEVTLKGIPDKNGLVIDFHDLNDLVENEILTQIDHRYLNDILDFNPTCELLGLWIWEQLLKKIEGMECSLEKVVLWETPTSYITIDAKDFNL